MPVRTLYTVGHGNRTLPEFTGLLNAVSIQTLVDVRAFPSSRRHPHFSRERLKGGLGDIGIEYRWMGERLGGRRAPRADSPHGALAADIRGFADYMRTEEFKTSALELMDLARQSTTAIMCAERQPEHCHRSLIADYLVCHGLDVVHLVGLDERREHRLNAAARQLISALDDKGDLPATHVRS